MGRYLNWSNYINDDDSWNLKPNRTETKTIEILHIYIDIQYKHVGIYKRTQWALYSECQGDGLWCNWIMAVKVIARLGW